jgi:Holliday junction DNA helicase RuvA
MIASVRGLVTGLSPEGAVVEVGGVGLAVSCAPNTISALRIGAEATLATSLVVREDSLTLYGFIDEESRSLFELLQTASGVGPRLAQAVLSVHTPEAVRRAISGGDTATLTRVPGIGKKGAEKLIIELRDRIGAFGGSDGMITGGAAAWQEQVRQALTGLGWTQAQADQAVAGVAEQLEPGVAPPAVPVLLKRAIAQLGRIR